MGGFGLLPVPDGGDEAAAHQALPDAVGHNLGEALVLRRGDQGGETVAGAVRLAGERGGDVLVAEAREGPGWGDGGAGREGHLDQGFAAAGPEAVQDHAARGRERDRLGLKHRGELDQLTLFRDVGRGVVAARALHFHAQECGADDDALGRHRHVVLRGDAEPGRPAEPFAAFHPQQFGDEQVERLVVDEGFVQPPAEGAGVVERGVDQVGVLGEDVQPVAHLVIGPARIAQQPVDDPGAPVGRGIPAEGGDLGLGGDDADGIEGHPAQEGEVRGQRREFEARNVQIRPRGALLDPAPQERDLARGERIALGGHHLLGISAGNPPEQRTPRRLMRRDRGAIVLAAGQRGRAAVEAEPAFDLGALVAAVAARLEDRLDLAVEIDAPLASARASLDGDLGDACTDEMVDGVQRGKTGRKVGHGFGARRAEPLGGGRPAGLPVGCVLRAAGGARGTIDAVEPQPAFGFVGVPPRVRVGHGAFARGQQVPRRRSGQLNRDHRLTEFGAERLGVLAGGLKPADQGLEDHLDGAVRGKGHGRDGFAVTRGGETVTGTEVDERVLFLDGQLPGVADGELAGLVEGRGEHLPAVDENARGAPGTQEQAMFSGGQADLGRGTDERREGAVRADAGGDILVWQLEEAEDLLGVPLRHDRIGRPGIVSGHSTLADLNQNRTVGAQRGHAENVDTEGKECGADHWGGRQEHPQNAGSFTRGDITLSCRPNPRPTRCRDLGWRWPCAPGILHRRGCASGLGRAFR